MKNLLTEGGAGAHMAHPFDLDYVKTGEDLLSFFTKKVPAYLSNYDPHIKTDGVNTSFKLIKKTNSIGEEKREFAADRGSQKPIDLEGITAGNITQRFKEGHGMIPAIMDVLTILNDTLETGLIDEELKILGLWDNPDYFINTEYVKETEERPVMNVIKYNENFLAFHGIKEFFRQPSPKGKSLTRTSREVKPTRESTNALMSFARKVARFGGKYNIYGPEDAKASLREGSVINFDHILGQKISIRLTDQSDRTDTLGGWLRNSNTKNPFGATVTLANGKTAGAMSKHVYFSLILKKVPISELLSADAAGEFKMAIDAINGAIFYHATRLLGRTVLESLYTSFGGSTADKHEGIVMRDKEIFNFSGPIKITGDFIYTGAAGAVSQQISKEAPQLEPGVKRKIAVFPGAFKPPHRGHMNLVEALLEKGVDQVAILVSKLDRKTPAGKPINRSVSERIWQIYIDSKGLGDRVFVGESPYNAPVKAAYEVLKGNVPDLMPETGDMIIPAASDKPDKYGKPDYERFINFHKGIKGIIDGVTPANIMEWYYRAPKEDPMSASKFRAALDTGKGLQAFLPTGVDPREVLNVLGVSPEEEPKQVDEISTMKGGNVEGAPSGGQFPGLDVEKENRRQKEISGIRRESKLVNQVLNYLLERLEFHQ